ncbi:uncharacterized protein LOC131327758 [Rhododendron vialii]|uniref:uncharacterized protein LOC131327758 n=1 Tax=Rhododendron vialii TaxID=182163 RepID=UPI0026603AA0|nr:uncharacterized protein LOC131327758 [Rhododendron vialii]
MYTETPDHNRPLFITGLVLNTKISRVLVDGGSAVNLLPKRALGIIGVRLSQLQPCHLVIQGFNQNEQHPMGKIKLRTKFGGIKEDTEFLVIDVDTSYNALLGRPWSHNHMAVPSTYHQCIKYPLPPPINEGIIVADNDPFNGVEAYYADARFYTKASQNRVKGSAETDTKSVKSPTKRAFRYIPKSQRKPGTSALAPINPTLELKDAFVLPLQKAECTYVENYCKFVVPAKAKGMKPIVFHALGDMEKKVQDDNLKTVEILSPIRPSYAANITKMLVKAGLDPEKVSTQTVAPFDSVLTHAQAKSLQQGSPIVATREGLGYQVAKEKLSVNMITVEGASNDGIEDETYPIPTQSEEEGQATIDELREVNLGDEGENKPTFISANLVEEEAQRYISFLKEHRDVFAWTYNEMPGLDPGVAVHRLAVHPEKRPVKQAPRRTRPELTSQIEAEVDKLLTAGFIREVKYPTWLANIVPVPKKNGKIRICIDFRDLNEACPKDDFPLPITKLLVDATTGYETLSFMDGYSGYNQIRMAPEDEKLTAFRSPKGIFCYMVMPFGLKNAGATYQRAMTVIFGDMLHNIIECYVDDLVAKTRNKEDHLDDLKQIFERLRWYKLKMNPLKCAFGVCSGKFLGFVVRSRGIEIDPVKIKAILEMPPPKNLKELKGLQGRLAYIRRFISNLAGRCLPFSRLMKKELNYSPIEKTCLALVFALQKLRHYVLEHEVKLISKADPLKYILSRPILSGKIAKWAVILQQFAIEYVSQKAVKGQALADFLAAHPIPDDSPLATDLPDEEVMQVEVQKAWEMYFDGATRSPNGQKQEDLKNIKSGISVVFVTPNNAIIPHSFALTEGCSNNEAEYEAVIAGLELALQIPIEELLVYGDSELVIKQLRGEYIVKKASLAPYHERASQLLSQFKKVNIFHVKRRINAQADSLASLAASLSLPEAITVTVGERRVLRPLTEISEVLSIFAATTKEGEEDWREPFINYLQHGRLPEDKAKRAEAHEVMAEVHSGVCGANQSGPKLHMQLKRLGYYWPTMISDCINYAKSCQVCQYHGNFIHQPPEPLHVTTCSWPFAAWGIDVIGPIKPSSSAGNKYIKAATDYFSKWAEAIALKETKSGNVSDFIRTHIIYRFGVPDSIITDNGQPFRSGPLYKLYSKYNIKINHSSRYHAPANSLAEARQKLGQTKNGWF